MSQSGILDIENSNPQIPTRFDADSGFAIPIANILNIYGIDGVVTSASGNTIEIALAGGDQAIDSVGVDYGTSPITPDLNGLINLYGNIVVAGSNPIRTNGVSANTANIEIQLSQALIAQDSSKVGLCNFNNQDFVVSSDGFVSSNLSITGDSGTVVTSSTVQLYANSGSADSGATVKFVGASFMEMDLVVTDANLNTMIGKDSGNSTFSNTHNTGLGYLTLNNLTSGQSNSAFSGGAGANITSGSNNTLLGYSSGGNISTGSYNTLVGYVSGLGLTVSDSSNVFLAADDNSGTNHRMRLGTTGVGNGQVSQCFIAAITGVTVAGSPVAVASTGQMSDLGFGTSTQVLTSNGAGVSPTWQAVPALITTTYTAGQSGNWSANANTKYVQVYLWAGGGGGASGRKGSSGSSSGGGGGAGGQFLLYQGAVTSFSGSIAYSVASSANGASAQTTDATDGITGTTGNNTTFGTTIAKGGGAGTGGNTVSGTAGAGATTGQSSSGGTGRSIAGNPSTNILLTFPGIYVPSGGGGGSGGNTGSILQGGTAGGYLDSTGANIVAPATGGIESGTIAGGNGGTAYAANGVTTGGFGGGGGGGASAGATGGAGGNGSTPGGGGGGGGGGISAQANSGAGGNGAGGLIIIIEFV